jgi:hypothetical protein
VDEEKSGSLAWHGRTWPGGPGLVLMVHEYRGFEGLPLQNLRSKAATDLILAHLVCEFTH